MYRQDGRQRMELEKNYDLNSDSPLLPYLCLDYFK